MFMQNNIEQPNTSGLKKFWKKLIDIFFTKQFMLFVGIGIVNTLNGIWIPTVLSLVMNANVAFAIGYIPCLGISYLLNSKFTFHEKLSLVFHTFPTTSYKISLYLFFIMCWGSMTSWRFSSRPLLASP